MDNTKKVVRQQADVSQGDELVRQIHGILAECGLDPTIELHSKLTMKFNSLIHRRDNTMFNQGYKTAEKEMGERHGNL